MTDPCLAVLTRLERSCEDAREEESDGGARYTIGRKTAALFKLDDVEALVALAKLTSALPPAQEAVERVAAAIFESKNISIKYAQIQDEKKDDFRRYARAAIQAMGEATRTGEALGMARAAAQVPGCAGQLLRYIDQQEAAEREHDILATEFRQLSDSFIADQNTMAELRKRAETAEREVALLRAALEYPPDNSTQYRCAQLDGLLREERACKAHEVEQARQEGYERCRSELLPMRCPECGPTRIDEDGCCVTCGRDTEKAKDPDEP